MNDYRVLPEGARNPYASHPGFDAQGCHLQYTVVPALYASSRPGFGCEVTGGHCLPGDQCEARRAKFPESCGTGEDMQLLQRKNS